MAGIASLAFHFPVHSIRAEAYRDMWEASRAPGIEEKTVAGYDEDVVTLAVEAARKLRPSDPVGFLAAATREGPEVSPTIALALGVEEAKQADYQGPTNASGDALRACMKFVDAHQDPAVLSVASVPGGTLEDPGERPMGAAAAALLVTPNGSLQIEASAHTSAERMGEADSPSGAQTRGGMELAREAIQATARDVLAGFEGQVASHEPTGDFASQTLNDLIPDDRIGGGVVRLSGDTGCVSALLALAEVLHAAERGDPVGLVTYGAGSTTVLALRMGSRLRVPSPLDTLSGDRSYLDYPTYARYRTFLADRDPQAEVSQGAYVSLPTYLEFAAARFRLVASRCTACDRVDFPPRQVCLKCGGHEFVDEPLSGKGEVYARTIIAAGSSPTEFRAQQELIGSYAVALVQLEEGPRIITQLTEADPPRVEIGMPVEAVLRRIYRQEGVVRYGYKFRPVSAPDLAPETG